MCSSSSMRLCLLPSRLSKCPRSPRGHPFATLVSRTAAGGTESSTAPTFSEQIVDIPVPGGGLQGFRPGQGSAASSSSSHSPACVHEDADEPGEGFFALFTVLKNCEGHPALECESAPERQLIHAERSSHNDEEREQAWCRFEDSLGRSFWHMLTTDRSGAQAVKVPQIQFFDDKVAGQFQFLDKVMVGPVLCNDSCRCSLACSTLTSC